MQISTAERLMGVLGYLAFLFIIPVKVRRDSMFVQFHARQGGVLFMLWFALMFVMLILLFVLSGTNIAETIVLGIMMLGTLYYAVMAFIGIFKVALGERYRMPVVADVALMMRL